MAIPFLNNISLNNNEIQNVKLHNTGTISSPAAGHIYFDTDDNIAKYYNGSAWIEIVASTGGTVTSVTSGNANTITIDGTATDPTVAANTAAVTNGSTNLATGDQIYDFVIGYADPAGTDNSTDVSLAGSLDYITISGQVITRNAIDLTTDVTGALPIANGGTGQTTAAAAANALLNTSQGGSLTIGDGSDSIVIPGDLQVTGTVTTNNVETVSTSNGVIFEGSVADANELILLAGTLTADRTVTLPDATGTVALTSNLLTTKTALINVSVMGSNTVATINHGLGSDYLVVQLYDVVTGAVVFADIEYTSDGSTLSDDHVRIEFSSTPTNNIRVVIIDASTGVGSITPTYP